MWLGVLLSFEVHMENKEIPENIREILELEGLVGPVADRLESALIGFIREEFAFSRRWHGATVSTLEKRLTARPEERESA